MKEQGKISLLSISGETMARLTKTLKLTEDQVRELFPYDCVSYKVVASIVKTSVANVDNIAKRGQLTRRFISPDLIDGLINWEKGAKMIVFDKKFVDYLCEG